MPIEKMDHYAIRTDNLEPTRDFYRDVIGFTEGPRPDFGFPGHWLYLNDVPVIHLIYYDHNADGSKFDGIMGRRDKYAEDGTGSIDHVAFRATDFEGMRERFKSLNVKTKENYIPDFDLNQIFIDDPNGVTVELNFFGPGGGFK